VMEGVDKQRGGSNIDGGFLYIWTAETPNKTFTIVSFAIGQFENTSFLCWSQLGNGVREKEKWLEVPVIGSG